MNDRLIRSLLRERFTVTLKTGETFDGILVDSDRTTIRLQRAVAIDAKMNRAPVDGDLFLPRAQIAYLQKPGAEA